MVAPDTFEACDDIGHLHARHQPAESLQIAIASAIELHVGDNAVLHLHIDVAGAGTLGLVGYHILKNKKATRKIKQKPTKSMSLLKTFLWL